MKPATIIQRFHLDTSNDPNDFLVAADWADEQGLDRFAQMLRDQAPQLCARQGSSSEGYGYFYLVDGHGAGCGAYEYGIAGAYGDGDGMGIGYGKGSLDAFGNGSGEGYGHGGFDDNHPYGKAHPNGSGSGGDLDEFHSLQSP